MAINELRALSIFIKTAELGSLRKAAFALNLSPQAASQALAQLEQHLDVRLFHRTTRVMSLTDEGQRLVNEAQPALLSLERAIAHTKEGKNEMSGPLRIVGPRTTFIPILWRLLDEFCTQYPSIQPDVQLEDAVGNWVEDRVDVGFRLGPSAEEGVIARALFPSQLILCAAPKYLSRYGVPHTLAELTQHRCSAFRNSGLMPWFFKVDQTVINYPLPIAFYSNDENLELQAILAGQCMGQLSGATAAPYLRSGQLLPLLVQYMPDIASYFVYYGSRRSQPARVRAFVELAIQRLVGNTEYVLSTEELITGEQYAKTLVK
ncbi:LysR family transcriptional regulator [uncultured Thiothrix sp.]|uniref:LysR family transcriptional regulator n=1 Tax=uncultured Thiothrix sp. TaxID=223185 RepID=UPI0026025A4B|nr:LysR family transcriptional regulator [uncultured Thiothrix sp.]